MKSLSKMLIAACLVWFGTNAVKAQSSFSQDREMKAKEVKNFVHSKDYVFEATREDMKGTDKALGYHRYDVALAHDTLVANLPGKSAPVKFDCTNYAYSSWQDNSGHWGVVIKPQDAMTDVKQIKMDISPQGEAKIFVSRSDGPAMSFNGYIKQEQY